MARPKNTSACVKCGLRPVYGRGLCQRHWSQDYRLRTNNKSVHVYEKTKNGFLMRVYRNMKSRVTGVQWKKFPLYMGLEILPKEDFYKWAKENKDFHILFDSWEQLGYPRTDTPSVDRINSYEGYKLENMRWVTHSENSRLGALSEKRKPSL